MNSRFAYYKVVTRALRAETFLSFAKFGRNLLILMFLWLCRFPHAHLPSRRDTGTGVAGGAREVATPALPKACPEPVEGTPGQVWQAVPGRTPSFRAFFATSRPCPRAFRGLREPFGKAYFRNHKFQ